MFAAPPGRFVVRKRNSDSEGFEVVAFDDDGCAWYRDPRYSSLVLADSSFSLQRDFGPLTDVVAMVPAPGWKAKWDNGDEDPFEVPVVAWAAFADGQIRPLEYCDSFISAIDDKVSGFVGLVHESDSAVEE